MNNTIYRFLIALMVISTSFSAKAQDSLPPSPPELPPELVKESIANIDYYLRRYTEWYPQNYDVAVKMRSLVHYLKDQRVDTILKSLESYQTSEDRYFFRTIDNVSDSLEAPGYINHQMVQEEQAKIDRNVRSNTNRNAIKVPKKIIEQAQLNIKLLTPKEAYKLIELNYVTLPDSLLRLEEIMAKPNLSKRELDRLQKMDSVKNNILELARLQYNENKLKQAEDSITTIYREEVVTKHAIAEQRKYAEQIAHENRRALEVFNEQATQKANETIAWSLAVLLDYVNREQLSLWIYNSMEDSTEVLLSNSEPFVSRFYIKNEQQDSLGVRILAKDRQSLAIHIDDGVTINRFQEQKHREADFARVKLTDRLTDMEKKYEIVTPWTYGFAFNAGLNQTYLKNWVKGGETSLSGLLTFKGYANYKLDKVVWSNSLDVRNGWISPSDGGFEKNEDKFEIISNFGYRAVKKWYYTVEADLETQLFNSYNYPDREKPKSGFLAPLKSLFKLGMDFKDGDLSLFVSPMTMKCVSVRDTSLFDQTKFGIEEDAKRYWDLGFNVDVKYARQIMENFRVQTKYKMFMDYQNIFTAYDIDWENTFDFKINDFLRAQVILHLLYDDNVTFDTGELDANGEAIKKAKWQFKEFVSLGFTYTIDKKIKRRRKIIN